MSSTTTPPETEIHDAPQADDSVCDNCSKPWVATAEWCGKCGFYPKFGTFIDIEKEEDEDEAASEKQDKPLEWSELFPPWVQVLAAALVAVTVLSIAARYVTADGSHARFYWAVAQLAVGGLLVFSAHTMAYVHAILEEDNFTLLDFLTRPVGIWAQTFKVLPEGARRLQAAVLGSWVILLALLVVDGLPWNEWLSDEPPPKKAGPNLVAAITENVANENAAHDNLEDAVEDFAGKQDLTDEEDDKSERLEKRYPESIDAVVVAFKRRREQELASISLAGVHQGKLQYIGTLTHGIPPTVEQEMRVRLEELKRPTAFVRIPGATESTVYVQPIVTCRVRFKRWTSSGRIVGPRFEARLHDVRQ